jgi:hypothetical protein
VGRRYCKSPGRRFAEISGLFLQPVIPSIICRLAKMFSQYLSAGSSHQPVEAWTQAERPIVESPTRDRRFIGFGNPRHDPEVRRQCAFICEIVDVAATPPTLVERLNMWHRKCFDWRASRMYILGEGC